MTTFYVVNNWENCYNIYSTREKAEKAVEILKDRVKNHYSEEHLNERFFIFEVKEGHAFGEELRTDCSETQNVILENQ